MTQFGKTIKLFLIDGDPNGRMTCELSTRRFLLVLSSSIGIIAGVFMTLLIQTLVKNNRNKKAKKA